MAVENKFVRESSPQSSVSVYTQDPGPAKFHILGLDPVLIRRIVTLGWPVILGMLTQSAINTIDLLMVGHLRAELAVPGTAAILSAIVLLWGFGGFLSSISVGTQAIAARRYSEGNFSKAGQVLSNSLTVSVISALIMTFVAIALAEPLMNILAPSATVGKIGTEYSIIRFYGLIPMAVMASYKSFYDGIGRVRVHMCIAIIMNICNIVFNYFLIFGFTVGSYVFAPMEIMGAAWGSLFSGLVGLLIMIWWTMRKHDRKTYQVYSLKQLNPAVAGTITRLSLWSGLATVVLMAGVGLFNYIIGMVDRIAGTADINTSAASIIIHVMMLVFMCSLAFGIATATLVSQSVGAGQPNLAERYGWQSVRLTVYVMAIFGIIVVIFPEPVLHIFLPADASADSTLKAQVVQIAIPSLRLAAGALSPLAAAAMVLTQALYGAGNTRYVMIVEFILHFGCLVPLAYLFSIVLGFGLIGCWYAAIAYAGGLFIATALKFRQGQWKNNKL